MPSLTSTNSAFWTHEWEKHGTCMNFTDYKINNRKNSNTDDSELYFMKSLELYNKINVDNFFGNQNYFTSPADLNKKLKLRFNSNVDTSCFYDKESKKQYLKELRFNFDKIYEILRNDTISQHSSCYGAKPVYIYPERYASLLNYSYYYKYSMTCVLIFIGLFIF